MTAIYDLHHLITIPTTDKNKHFVIASEQRERGDPGGKVEPKITVDRNTGCSRQYRLLFSLAYLRNEKTANMGGFFASRTIQSKLYIQKVSRGIYFSINLRAVKCSDGKKKFTNTCF